MSQTTPRTGGPKATIYDVAEHAGVSIATVSRTFNGTGSVAESPRDRVRAAARTLRFRPSRAARSLAQRQASTIGVAVPAFTTPFHNELLKGVRDRLDGHESDLLLHDLDWKRPAESLRTFLAQGAIDGLLLAGVEAAPDLRLEMGTLGGPAVVLGAAADGLDTFEWDDEEGARRATRHLLQQGGAAIRMIATHHEDPTCSARIAGYEAALREAGINAQDDWVAAGTTDKQAGYSAESGREAMQVLLGRARSANASIDAVFASSDVQAMGAWQALRDEGLRVPEDVALIGYDDVKTSRFIGLSSVSQHITEVGWEATDLLLQRMEGSAPPTPVSRTVVPDVMSRGSA